MQPQRFLSLMPAALVALMVPMFTFLAVAQSVPATFSVLYAFQGGNDGAYPSGKLLVDASGNVYGVTDDGGDKFGFGTVYKLDPTGKETILHEFTGKSDGGYAFGGLVQDADGNLYGTTSAGGNASCGGRGCGVVFKLDPSSGKETVLYQFSGGNDGASPNGDLVLDDAGNLYGTTFWGPYGFGGIVFKVDQNGVETVLHEFSGLPDGEFPVAGLFRDQKGNLFGTTSAGGGGACWEGCGTVFKLDPTGRSKILYRFLGSPDGNSPFGGVIKVGGHLYGTAYNGGHSGCVDRGPGCGTVFGVSTSGREETLYRFRNRKSERDPWGGLIQDAAGNFYGTTSGGDSPGTVFKLDVNGNETILHRFTGGEDGCGPEGSLTFDPAGNLYGVARSCGPNGYGVVFKVGTQ